MRFLHLIFLLTCTTLAAQQEPVFSQFFYNKLLSNPGAAGSTGLPCFTAFHRQQWVGLEGAPVTQALGFNTPLLAGRVGLGLTLASDRIGFFSSTYGNMAYAYRIEMGGGELGLGMHASLLRQAAALTDVRTISGSLAGAEMMESSSQFNVGTGAHFENERFFVGVSVPYMLDRGLANGQVRHFFGNLGGVMELSPKVKMRTAAAVRVVKNAPPSFDAHLGFGFLDARMWLGSTLRMSSTTDGLGGDALVAVAQYQIGYRLRAGFAYDAALGSLQRRNAGTFELMLEYSFINKVEAAIVPVRRPRYF